MNKEQFTRQLAEEGFTTAEAGEYPPGCINEDHSHAFEVRGLVLSGEMTISSANQVQRSGPGDVFVMRPGEIHQEVVGDDGVSYLYGRRDP